MSKKYDNNLNEIKETRTFATNNTSTFFTCDTCGRSVGGITIVNGMRFCAKCYQETFGNNQITELKQQLVEKDEKIRELKEELENETDFKNEYYKYWQDLKEEMLQKCKEIGQLEFNLAKKRHQICDEAKKRIVKETCYDTEEEVRNAIYDFNAREVLKILDDIEKGE